MNDKCWLLCEVGSEDKDNWLISSKLEDGTRFQIGVSKHIVTKIPNVAGNWAWLEATYTGESNGRVALVLPVAILDKGSTVTVRKDRVRTDDPSTAPKETSIVYVMKNIDKEEKDD